MKTLIVFGTRPEAIKMAPLVKQLQANKAINCSVCVTAQHREMLDQVLEIFQIEPDYDLNIMRAGQDLYDITSQVIVAMRDVIDDCQPDGIFVHGDTTTSTVTALAGFYQQIPIYHVEAGLRTYERYSPFPEEINRQLTGKLTSYHFAPTKLARQNLLNEGVADSDIWVTGNTVIDALLMVKERIQQSKDLQQSLTHTLQIQGYNIDNQRAYILVTGHRRENFGEGFRNICTALSTIAQQHPDYDIVYPVHLNPNVKQVVNEQLGKINNVYLIPPLDYLHFVYLMMHSHLVLTDSGGIQEEAPSLGKPVLVMRNTTERPEAVKAGTVILVGTNIEKIVTHVSQLLDNKKIYTSMTKLINPYGDGKASAYIENALLTLNKHNAPL